MKLYIVERMGVYSQGIVGVFSTPEIAEQAMLRAKERESDNYHTFDITEMELNEEQQMWDIKKEAYETTITPMCCKHPPDGIGCAGTSIKDYKIDGKVPRACCVIKPGPCI